MEGRTLGDGAVLDVRTGRWSRVDPSPFPHGLFSPAAAFDGVEVVVVGTECDETIPAPTLGVPPECRGPAAAAWGPDRRLVATVDCATADHGIARRSRILAERPDRRWRRASGVRRHVSAAIHRLGSSRWFVDDGRPAGRRAGRCLVVAVRRSVPAMGGGDRSRRRPGRPAARRPAPGRFLVDDTGSIRCAGRRVQLRRRAGRDLGLGRTDCGRVGDRPVDRGDGIRVRGRIRHPDAGRRLRRVDVRSIGGSHDRRVHHDRSGTRGGA